MEYVNFINLSPIQCFDNREHADILAEEDNEINTSSRYDENINHNIDNKEPVSNENNNSNNKIKLELLEEHDNNISQDLVSKVKVKSETLNLLSNVSKLPKGNSRTVTIKTPVILAQLIIPINISSSIKLPEKIFEIIDIKSKLRLEECILLQTSNILFIKGFINKEIQYYPINSTNNGKVYKKIHHTIDIPFKCSTSVNFFTQPLESTMDIKEVFQYDEKKFPEFNQISENFFNENPFCKLLYSQIIEHNKYLDFEDSKNECTKIEDNMTIKLKIEILQNQPIVIPLNTNNKI